MRQNLVDSIDRFLYRSFWANLWRINLYAVYSVVVISLVMIATDIVG